MEDDAGWLDPAPPLATLFSQEALAALPAEALASVESAWESHRKAVQEDVVRRQREDVLRGEAEGSNLTLYTLLF